MTSENNLNANKDLATNNEEKVTLDELPTTPDTKEEKRTAVVSFEESLVSNEDKPMNIEKFDSAGEKEAVDDDVDETKADDQMDIQPLFEQPTVVEGKRSRKPTLRLEIAELVPVKKNLSIPQGHGKPLGEIEYINYQITHATTDTLFRMRSICFGRRGNKASMRKNLREFKGFEFDCDSDEYQKHLSNLIKLKKDQLRSISNILGLPSTGRNTDHAKRILDFLLEPVDEGKRMPRKKSSVRTAKKRSTNSKGSIDTDQETKKQKMENGNVKHEETVEVTTNGTTDSTSIAKMNPNEGMIDNTVEDEN